MLRNRKALSPVVIALIVLGVAIILIAGAVTFYVWIGAGNLKTETMQFSDFTRLDVGSAFEVTITRSNTYSVIITANERIFGRVEVTKTGDTLRIQLEPGTISTSTLKAEIAMPELISVVFSGATRGTANGFNVTERFTVVCSGASSLEMTDITSRDINVELSGGSTLTGQGSGNNLSAGLSGASTLDFSNFHVNDTRAELTGASHAVINLDGRLDVAATGASAVEYVGEPTLGNINTSGGSTVTKR